MDADLGSLASDVAKRGITGLGEEAWQRHIETVKGLWDSIAGYFEELEVSNFKVYQDGMIADGAMGQKILDEGLKSGSRNYEIISKLIQRGAVLVKTEDFALVKKERDMLLRMTSAKKLTEKVLSRLEYRLTKNDLLRKRDRFIAGRINETLNQGETGILFIGAYHEIIPMLDKDIQIKQIKEAEKIEDYQKTFFCGMKEKEKLETLSKYLLSPIDRVLL